MTMIKIHCDKLNCSGLAGIEVSTQDITTTLIIPPLSSTSAGKLAFVLAECPVCTEQIRVEIPQDAAERLIENAGISVLRLEDETKPTGQIHDRYISDFMSLLEADSLTVADIVGPSGPEHS